MSAVGRPKAPPRAARRAPWRTVDFVALDFEATGLDFARDAIISFGAVPIRSGRIDVGRSVYELVDPGSVSPSPASIVVHGLRRVDLVDARSLESAKHALAEALERRFIVTWFATVEAGFLDKLFGGGSRRWLRRAVDVRDLVMADAGPRSSRLTLTAAAERYGVPVADPHHALEDALVTAQLFLVLAARVPEAASFSAMRRWVSRANAGAPPAGGRRSTASE